jgi:putative nucleotidyltransferase with HDIG domain
MRARSGGGAGSQPPDADLAGAADESLRTMMLVARQVRIGGRAGSVIAVPCITAGSASSALLVWLPEGGSLAPSQLDTLSTLGSLTSIAVGNAELRESERNFFTHVTNLLVATLDRYLDDRSDHSRRVAAVANQISHALQLPERQRERLHFAALLHDIGMLQIPRAHANDRILARRHVEAGDEMLRPIRLWEDLAPLVRHHHEHWDGGGYPDGLSGDRIPLESRIIAVAEAFDAMTAEKSYKPAIAIPEALDRLEEAAGSQFDPDVVKAFVSTRR